MIRLVLTTTALALAGPAHAITCSFDTITPVSFGAYDVFTSSPLDSTGTVRLVCTAVIPADNITIDLDAGGGGSFAPRRLARSGGGTPLSYNLFNDAARTTRWGDGTSGTSHYGPANPPDGAAFDLTVYGRVTALQDVAAGTYADSVVATINS